MSLDTPLRDYARQALLLTGARREELAGLKWEDVDFQWKSITIRDKVEGWILEQAGIEQPSAEQASGLRAVTSA